MDVGELKAGDTLLFKVQGYGILYPIARCLMKFGHVALYWTETKRGLPLIIESCWGKGVIIRTLYAYRGRTAYVYRPKADVGTQAAKRAERLADSLRTQYDYFAIAQFCIPKLILLKLNSKLPRWLQLPRKLVNWCYGHNTLFFCSEMVARAYREADYPLVDEGTVPLPDDIAQSRTLTCMGELKI